MVSRQLRHSRRPRRRVESQMQIRKVVEVKALMQGIKILNVQICNVGIVARVYPQSQCFRKSRELLPAMHD